MSFITARLKILNQNFAEKIREEIWFEKIKNNQPDVCNITTNERNKGEKKYFTLANSFS